MRKSPGLCTAERLLRRLASIFPAAAFLALAACSTDSKPDKPEKIAIAAPPAVLTFESAKSLVAVASSDTIWNGIAISDNDPNITSEALAKKVTCFFNSPTCGGTTIDAAGNLCVTDANEKRILKVTPAGQSSVPVQDPRLIWADALWIDHAGNLWIPAAQINRTAGQQKGVQTVAFPVQLFKMPIGAKPFRN